MSTEEDRAIIDRLGPANIRRNEKAVRRRNLQAALFFMSPAILLTTVLLLLPVLFNIYLSFTRWEKFKGLDQWGGLENYQTLLLHPQFEQALLNTVVWVVATLIAPVLLGLALALALRGLPFENLFKNIIFLPRVLAPTSVGVIWFYVYAPHGLLNSGLQLFSDGPTDIGWLYQDNTIMPAIVATYVWQQVGLIMVLLLLGLAAIPQDPIEAAKLDGATERQTLQYIILPLLTPTLLVVSMISIIAAFGAFDLLWVMALSYPGRRTLSLSVYMYFEGFGKGQWAYASAIAVLLGAITLCITWAQAYMQARAERLKS